MWQMLISLENSESNYCVVHLGMYIDTAAVIVMHYAHTRPRKDIIQGTGQHNSNICRVHSYPKMWHEC